MFKLISYFDQFKISFDYLYFTFILYVVLNSKHYHLLTTTIDSSGKCLVSKFLISCHQSRLVELSIDHLRSNQFLQLVRKLSSTGTNRDF